MESTKPKPVKSGTRKQKSSNLSLGLSLNERYQSDIVRLLKYALTGDTLSVHLHGRKMLKYYANNKNFVNEIYLMLRKHTRPEHWEQ